MWLTSARHSGLYATTRLTVSNKDDMRESPASRAPTREQVLHLTGRHPFLTIHQLAHLLGTSSARITRLEQELVESGWLRRIELDELPKHEVGLRLDEYHALGLAEITIAGRRHLASWLGLEPTTATRYHGFVGNARAQAGRRRRLLRTVAHTLARVPCSWPLRSPPTQQ